MRVRVCGHTCFEDTCMCGVCSFVGKCGCVCLKVCVYDSMSATYFSVIQRT